jgi:hypothetical protein
MNFILTKASEITDKKKAQDQPGFSFSIAGYITAISFQFERRLE